MSGDVTPLVTAAKTGELVQFDYSVGDRVRIKETSIEADVSALLKDEDGGKQYRIVWWYGGSRICQWVFPREIRRSDSQR
jgi:hypothetical protein